MGEYNIMRGDIFYVTKYGDTTGSEQSSGRSGVIVSNDTHFSWTGWRIRAVQPIPQAERKKLSPGRKAA